MKRFIKLILISALILYPNLSKAENEYITQELLNTPQENEVNLVTDSVDNGTAQNISSNTVDDNNFSDGVEEEFELFEQIGKKQEPSTTEESLYTRLLKTNITRTDVPSFLLKDELTHEFSKGPIKELQLFGGCNISTS